MSYGQTQSTLWGPHSLVLSSPPPTKQSDERPNSIEVSIHTLPRQLQREFQHVFDERNLHLDPIIQQHTSEKHQLLGPLEFLAIPTNQHAREDLVAVGDKIEAEKDRLLNVFMQFARAICEQLQAQGYWADFIDPCSGLPMLTLNCNKVYSEVDGMECCLGYKAYNAGFCKILTHPAWGSAVYPATMFAYAPQSVVMQIMNSFPKETKSS